MNQKTTKYKLICIVCPEGCEMKISERDGELIFPRGICRQGQDYARQEIYNPCRVLTTTVPIKDGEVAMLPIRTVQPIPKRKLIKAMEQIASLVVYAPIKIGDVVCRDIAATGVPMVACRSIDRER